MIAPEQPKNRPETFMAFAIFIIISVIALVVLFNLSSCSKKENNTTSVVVNCDVSNLRYSVDIKPIIDTYCSQNTNCHAYGSSTSVFITNYSQLNTQMSTGNFEYRVFVLKDMPIVPLASCNYNKLKTWYENGHPNN